MRAYAFSNRYCPQKPTHNYFVTPQCITDSRSQRLQLPRNLHKVKISLIHAYHATVTNTRFLQAGQPHVIFYSIHIYLTTSINIQLTHGSRTTVANTRFHKKGQAYQKSCQKMSFVKSHSIQKNRIYTGIPINCLLTQAIIRDFNYPHFDWLIGLLQDAQIIHQ